MERRMVGMGIFFLIVLSLSACSAKPVPHGWWWIEMAFQCGNGSDFTASIPFEVAQDRTLAGSGTVQGTVKLRPPLICPELRTVSIEGMANIAGHYTDSGEGGFVFDQLDFEVSNGYISETVCPGKTLSVIDRGIVSMDVAMFITSLETSWDTRINISQIGERGQEDAPDAMAQDGSETIMQVGFCNLNIIPHQGELQGTSGP